MNILCVNSCGLETELNYPEFAELIYKNDIARITETKTDYLN